MKIRFLPLFILVFFLLQGCQAMQTIPTVKRINLKRFMGDWYVIANIPTFIEKGAHNAIESYELEPDGTVATTFTFNQGSFDGPAKTYRPRGFIRDSESNAVWDMRFIWPFKAEYRIVHVNEDYSQTVIGRSKRDYLWIMARTPTIPPKDLEDLLELVEGLGYDPKEIEMVPHKSNKQNAEIYSFHQGEARVSLPKG